MKKSKSRSKSKKQKFSLSQFSGRLSTKTSLALLAVSAAFIAGAGIAYATIPDSNGVINACYNSGGVLRVVNNDNRKCSKGETSLSWSQQGSAAEGAGFTASTREFVPYGSVEKEVLSLPGFGEVTVNCAAAPHGLKLIYKNTSGQAVSLDSSTVANNSNHTIRDFGSPYSSLETDHLLLSYGDGDDSHVLSLKYTQLKNLPDGCTAILQATSN
jgi:hypothetical protein